MPVNRNSDDRIATHFKNGGSQKENYGVESSHDRYIIVEFCGNLQIESSCANASQGKKQRKGSGDQILSLPTQHKVSKDL
jgi:hypothetical protein